MTNPLYLGPAMVADRCERDGHEALEQRYVLASDYDALRAELEVANKDAARYRWLAENIETLPYTDRWGDKEWLDAAIDAAMKEPT